MEHVLALLLQATEFSMASGASLADVGTVLHRACGIEASDLKPSDFESALFARPDLPWSSLAWACASLLTGNSGHSEYPESSVCTLASLIIMGHASRYDDSQWEFSFSNALESVVKAQEMVGHYTCIETLTYALACRKGHTK
jgi:hypothetical protein